MNGKARFPSIMVKEAGRLFLLAVGIDGGLLDQLVQFPRGGDHALGSPLFAHSHQLRPVLEVHRVEVSPFAAPDEAVPLEDLHDLERDAVLVGAFLGP